MSIISNVLKLNTVLWQILSSGSFSGLSESVSYKFYLFHFQTQPCLHFFPCLKPCDMVTAHPSQMIQADEGNSVIF